MIPRRCERNIGRDSSRPSSTANHRSRGCGPRREWKAEHVGAAAEERVVVVVAEAGRRMGPTWSEAEAGAAAAASSCRVVAVAGIAGWVVGVEPCQVQAASSC